MKWLRYILDILMPKYSSGQHCIPAPSSKKKQVAQKLNIPLDKLSVSPTGIVMTYEKKVDKGVVQHEFNQLDKDMSSLKSGELTKLDIIILTDKNLDKVKAMEIKPLWAAGLSIAEVVMSKRRRRGFSQRTVAKYYSAFTSALSETVGEKIS